MEKGGWSAGEPARPRCFSKSPRWNTRPQSPINPINSARKEHVGGTSRAVFFLGVFEGVKCSSFQVPENTENSARKVYVAGGSVAKKASDAVYDFYTKIVPR